MHPNMWDNFGIKWIIPPKILILEVIMGLILYSPHKKVRMHTNLDIRMGERGPMDPNSLSWVNS